MYILTWKMPGGFSETERFLAYQDALDWAAYRFADGAIEVSIRKQLVRRGNQKRASKQAAPGSSAAEIVDPGAS